MAFKFQVPASGIIARNGEIHFNLVEISNGYYEDHLYFDDTYGGKYFQRIYLLMENADYRVDLGRVVERSKIYELEKESKLSYDMQKKFNGFES